MGNNQRRTPAHNLQKACLDLMLCFHINGTRRVIQNKNPRILKQCPGDSNPLLLAS
ncbi:hypothetical protein D3C75_1242610 [compost metagenome]